MGRYFARRVLGIIPLLLLISIIIFLFIHLIPGDPVRGMLGVEATGDELEAMRVQLGLKDPLIVQYGRYMAGLLTGDLGMSYKSGLPVAEMIATRIGATLRLTFFGVIWSIIIGTGIGLVSAVKRNSVLDYTGMVLGISGISIPPFWLGLVLINIFSVQLRWVPTGGLDSWQSYILPSFTIGCTIMGVLARYTRSSMVETLQEDYVRTAIAKGQRGFLVVLKHAFRNSLLQVITIAGLQIGSLLAGSVMVESVFTISGLGRLLVDSITFRDYRVIQALLMFYSLVYVVINLIVDLLYGVLNPKIRYK